MRTTLTLDDDVFHSLENLQEKRSASFKQAVNEALRAGLAVLMRSESAPTQAQYTTPTFDLGIARFPSLDNISEVLDMAEGDDRC